MFVWFVLFLSFFSDFSWHGRGLAPVKKIFENVWQTDDLLVSFDGEKERKRERERNK